MVELVDGELVAVEDERGDEESARVLDGRGAMDKRGAMNERSAK